MSRDQAQSRCLASGNSPQDRVSRILSSRQTGPKISKSAYRRMRSSECFVPMQPVTRFPNNNSIASGSPTPAWNSGICCLEKSSLTADPHRPSHAVFLVQSETTSAGRPSSASRTTGGWAVWVNVQKPEAAAATDFRKPTTKTRVRTVGAPASVAFNSCGSRMSYAFLSGRRAASGRS